MMWKGKELKLLGDLMIAVQQVKTKEDAAVFMALYEAENEYAKENVGYLAGYLPVEEKHRVFDLFGVSHPFFGMLDPTPEQARKMGQEMEDRWRNRAAPKAEEKEVDRTLPKRLIEP